MDENLKNRQAPTGKRRGRPTKEEVAARPEPTPVRDAPVVIQGMIAPCCGRALVPKTTRVADGIRYCRCSCGRNFKVFLNERGVRVAQPI